MAAPSSLVPGTTVGAALTALPLDPLENRILLCHALALPRVALITQSE
ncbi:MAG: peptide chain release factor N(5)-glutamine methyltransferase, partial [Oxalobacteraceae bacterium]